jgi:hypothetical protein
VHNASRALDHCLLMHTRIAIAYQDQHSSISLLAQLVQPIERVITIEVEVENDHVRISIWNSREHFRATRSRPDDLHRRLCRFDETLKAPQECSVVVYKKDAYRGSCALFGINADHC